MSDTHDPQDAEAGDGITPADERLLTELAEARGADPLPDGLLARAEGLLAFADVDRELAALLEEAALAGVRGDTDTTSPVGSPLVFEAAGVAVEVALARDELTGQLLDGEPTTVELEGLDGLVASTEPDALGRFRFTTLPAGPARLVFRGPVPPVTTDWFAL